LRYQGNPPDLKEATRLTKTQLEGLLNKHIWLTKIQADKLVLDPDTPMIELLIASIINKAVILGDEKRLTFVLDRIIGKVRQEVDLPEYLQNLQKLTEKQVIDLGKDAIKFLDKDDK
jgi:hypothetical protein